MKFLNTWLQGIIVSVIIATIIEMILPSTNNKKYIKMVLGIYIVFNIITPIINQITKNNFEISSIINIEEYTKKMETYQIETSNQNIDEINNNNIQEIYISKLKKDIKTKLEEKEYTVNNIEITLKQNETYEIEKLTLYIENKIDEENNDENKNEDNNKENTIQINEIQKVNIKVQNNSKTKEDTNIKNQITEKEKQKIKEYISSIYEIKEITIY